MGVLEFLFGKKTVGKRKTAFKRNECEAEPKDCAFSRNGKVYLNVPYAEKERAKALGARWDRNIKKWYFVPSEKDSIACM